MVVVGTRVARLEKPWNRLAPNAFIADLFRSLVRIAFVILGLVIALDILNATALLSTILGAAGLIGLAIGFAVRDTVENFIASVMLSIRQPFRPNDVVEINGDEGKVIRLTSRATILLSFDGNHVRIPKSTVFQEPDRELFAIIEPGTAVSVQQLETRCGVPISRRVRRAGGADCPETLPLRRWTCPPPDAGSATSPMRGRDKGGRDWNSTSATLDRAARREALRQSKLAIEAAGPGCRARSTGALRCRLQVDRIAPPRIAPLASALTAAPRA